MQYIVEIDGVVSTRYKYNVWSVQECKVEAESGGLVPAVAKDTRIFCSDSLDEFIAYMTILHTRPIDAHDLWPEPKKYIEWTEQNSG